MSPVLHPTEPHATQPTLAPSSSPNPRKRRASGQPLAPAQPMAQPSIAPVQLATATPQFGDIPLPTTEAAQAPVSSDHPVQPPAKKGRTNTPWSPAEEQRLKQMRDQGKSWSEIAKTFPNRTEGSVKKHWYKVRTTKASILVTF
jgi:hypothetical protein